MSRDILASMLSGLSTQVSQRYSNTIEPSQKAQILGLDKRSVKCHGNTTNANFSDLINMKGAVCVCVCQC